MKKNRTVLVIAEISILAAFSLALDYIAGLTTGSIYPNGGSISIAMVPIMVISFRRGILAGLTTGLIVGIIQVMWNGHVLQFFQFILDYPVPYTVVGLASLFSYFNKRKITSTTLILGAIFAGFMRYLSHYLAGVIFWGEYALEEFNLFGEVQLTGFNIYTWSVFYNGLYMIPTIIVSVVVLFVLFKYSKQLFVVEKYNQGTLEV